MTDVASPKTPSIDKKTIRPIYEELQGYFDAAPQHDEAIYEEKSDWEQVNTAIDLLNKATGNNYSRFKIDPLHGITGDFVRVKSYKQKLAGLTRNLHGEFFSNEPEPFSSIPNTVITQNQHQSANVVLLLDMQKQIGEKLVSTQDPKEKSFLEKLSSQLPSITNGVQLVKQALDLSTQMGLDPHQISKLFT